MHFVRGHFLKLLRLQETEAVLQDEPGDGLYFCYCQQVPQEGRNMKGVIVSLSTLQFPHSLSISGHITVAEDQQKNKRGEMFNDRFAH